MCDDDSFGENPSSYFSSFMRMSHISVHVGESVGFVYGLFNDTWSRQGHSVSCMTILFLNLQITRLDIRPYKKWAVSLVIAYGHFNLPREFVWVNILILSSRGECVGKCMYSCQLVDVNNFLYVRIASYNKFNELIWDHTSGRVLSQMGVFVQYQYPKLIYLQLLQFY